jgi:hypothetical protein
MWKRIFRVDDGALEQARWPMRGRSALATAMSTIALLFSAYSLYESSLRAAELAVYIPPRIDYTDPDSPESPFEVFVVPMTLANDGARSGTVLAINLEVTNPRTKQTKRFYAARFGTWREEPARPFAPVPLSGKTSASQTLQFFPRVGETIPRILDLEPGDYRFKLLLDTAAAGRRDWRAAGNVVSLEFEMQIGRLDYRNFNGNGVMEMWATDYRPAATTAQ